MNYFSLIILNINKKKLSFYKNFQILNIMNSKKKNNLIYLKNELTNNYKK